MTPRRNGNLSLAFTLTKLLRDPLLEFIDIFPQQRHLNYSNVASRSYICGDQSRTLLSIGLWLYVTSGA